MYRRTLRSEFRNSSKSGTCRPCGLQPPACERLAPCRMTQTLQTFPLCYSDLRRASPGPQRHRTRGFYALGYMRIGCPSMWRAPRPR
uniref:Helicase protein n=1 Tax=uncultured marine virus TaxID=186617 RepID=A0A0F7L6L8_9VIRU|nr:helicase protein [uncultured marine virus]